MKLRILRKFNRIYGPILVKIGQKEPLLLRDRGPYQYLIRALSTDPFIESEIFDEHVYDLKILPGDKVIDGGAHIGLFTLYALFRGAHVVAFEPDPDNWKLLYANVGLNPYLSSGRVWLERGALSSHHSTVNFYLAANKGNGSTVPYSKQNRSIEVPAFVLDDYLPYDVLKLDIEGGEYEVLESSDLSKVREIGLEYHKHGSSGWTKGRFAALFAKLIGAGLKVKRIEDNGYNGYLYASRD